MRTILLIIVIAFAGNLTQAQTKKVKEKDLGGIWQMRITLKDGLLEEEIEEEESAFAKMIMVATENMVEGVLEEIDIKFEFLNNGKCKVYASAFGESGDVSHTKWWINDRGQLFIDDSDTYSSQDGDYWLFEDDVLVLRDEKGKIDDDATVIMVRIDE
ncbi:MAG: hypothetical protein JXR07_06720 [Reichenbachiella sp.]